MLFSKAEMDALKVIGAYMDVPAKISDAETRNMLSEFLEYGYLKFNRARTSLRITEAGAEILIKAGFPAKTQSRSIGDGNLLERRLQSSQTAMFFNSLGIDVFSKEIPEEDKISRTMYLSTAELRRHNYANVLGMSKFIGLLYTSDFTYAVYNVSNTAESGKPPVFFPQIDEDIFRREIISANNPAKILYMSDRELNWMSADYVDAAKNPAKTKDKSVNVLTGFYQAIEYFTVPVCFIPFSPLGSAQMRIMLTENYKEKLAKYFLPSSYRPVIANFIDAQFGGSEKFLLVFIDFDVKRLQKAAKIIRDLNIVALKEQIPALTTILGEYKAKIYSIETALAFEVLGINQAEDTRTEQFRTEKGVGIIANRISKNNSKEQG